MRGTPQQTEVLDGLAAGDEVILHPSDQIADGVRVAALGTVHGYHPREAVRPR